MDVVVVACSSFPPFACLFVCVSACLRVCAFAHLRGCVLACLRACVFVLLCACVLCGCVWLCVVVCGCVFVCLFACFLVWFPLSVVSPAWSRCLSFLDCSSHVLLCPFAVSAQLLICRCSWSPVLPPGVPLLPGTEVFVVRLGRWQFPSFTAMKLTLTPREKHIRCANVWGPGDF